MGLLSVPRWASRAMATAASPLPTTKLAPPSPLYQLIPSVGTSSTSSASSDDSDSTYATDIDDLDPDHRSSGPRVSQRSPLARLDPLVVTAALLAAGMFIAMLIWYPFPTTIHAFVALAVGVVAWTFGSWARTLAGVALRKPSLYRYSVPHMTGLVVASILTLYWAFLGIHPPPESAPALPLDGERFFIAANLYNNEAIIPRWTDQIEKLIDHLGPNRTFVSVYESNSRDATPELLRDFGKRLDAQGVAHRIVSDTTERWWPYATSPERIRFLADARNKAMEPLQSPSADIRLTDYDSYTKVLFLNDVLFTWEGAMNLLATKRDYDGDYDLACAMDFGASGLYDTWVSRDVCGTPTRAFWPYVKDPVAAQRVRDGKTFELGACWNGMVAFPTQHYLYRPGAPAKPVPAHDSRREKRGWKLVDGADEGYSRQSPALSEPILFRESGVDACDHSECFLFSYDLHRLYEAGSGGPKIWMNPDVRTAYEEQWWRWNEYVLRVPMIQWWVRNWSHGLPFDAVNWIWEYLARHRDICTWAAFEKNAPARCPRLPSAPDNPWYIG